MTIRSRFQLLCAPWLMLACCLGCAADQPGAAAKILPAVTPGCLLAGDGELRVQMRGAIHTDLHWPNSSVQCDGDIRPDGKGLRITFSGRWHGTVSNALARDHQLRFIFGVDIVDHSTGVATVYPTNLTLIVEGEQTLFATLGDEKCAVENLERTPLLASANRLDKVRARGYCLGPAESANGAARLLIPTFDFTGVLRHGESK
jgi:hypothetical protein